MNENVRAELGKTAEEFWLHAPWQTLTDSEIDRDEFAYRTDLILLSFNRPGEVPKGKRRGPLALAPIFQGGTRIIATAFRKPPRLAARSLDDKEAVFLTRAAQLVVQLLESKRLGGLRFRNPREFLVFVLNPETGAPVSEELRKLEETQPSARAPFVVPSEARARLVSIKARGIHAVAWATPGIAVQGEEARALLVLDADDDFVLLAHAFGGPDPLPEAAHHLIAAMEGKIPSPTGRAVGVPRQVVTDSLEFYEYMKDALVRDGRAARATELHELFIGVCVQAREGDRLARRVSEAKPGALADISHYTTEPAAKELAKSHPYAAARLYRSMAERILNAGKSKYYGAAQGGQKGPGPVKARRARAKRPVQGRLPEAKLRAMIGEATIDCLDDEEAEMGLFNMVEDRLKVPFDVTLFGVTVTVESVRESPGGDIVADCGRERRAVSILDLPLPDPPPRGAEWIEAYRYWKEHR